MKLKNLLALFMALLLTLSCYAFAEEASDGETEDSTSSYFVPSSFLGPLTIEEWMSSAENRALIAMTEMLLAISFNAETQPLLGGDSDFPTVYITDSANADTESITVLFFLEDLEKLVSTMYAPALNQFTVTITDNSEDPELFLSNMESNGSLTGYEFIPIEECFQALFHLSATLNGEE